MNGRINVFFDDTEQEDQTMKTSVENMTSAKGNKVANQFIIRDERGLYFQSYATVIAFRPWNRGKVQLDRDRWSYSTTTGKYRNLFLGETKAETEAKIDDGTYELVDLN